MTVANLGSAANGVKGRPVLASFQSIFFIGPPADRFFVILDRMQGPHPDGEVTNPIGLPWPVDRFARPDLIIRELENLK